MCKYIITEAFKMDKYIYDENNGLFLQVSLKTNLFPTFS